MGVWILTLSCGAREERLLLTVRVLYSKRLTRRGAVIRERTQ